MPMIETDMTETLSRFLDVNVARYRLIADNLANVETPGYHTSDLDFRAELRRPALPETNAQAASSTHRLLPWPAKCVVCWSGQMEIM